MHPCFFCTTFKEDIFKIQSYTSREHPAEIGTLDQRTPSNHVEMFSLNKSVKNLGFYLYYSRSCAIPWRPEAVHSAGRKRSFLWPLPLVLPSLTDQCASTHWVQTFPRCLSLPVHWLWCIKENQNCFGKTHAHVPDKNVTKWNWPTPTIDFLFSLGKITKPEDFDKYIIPNQTAGGHSCSVCLQFTHVAKSNVRNHIESRHFPNSFVYNCAHCGHNLGTKKALQRHKARCKSGQEQNFLYWLEQSWIKCEFIWIPWVFICTLF